MEPRKVAILLAGVLCLSSAPIALAQTAMAPIVDTRPDSNDTWLGAVDILPTPEPEDDTTSDGQADEDQSSDSDQSQQRPRFDPQVVQRGRMAFEASCTQCHDAERSLQKEKSLSGWLGTVRRMAGMDGADISSSDIVPIATYLASLSAPAQQNGASNGTSAASADAAAEAADFGSGLSLSGTVSTLWRGGNDNLENPDFFADVWVRADWQPEGPLRARVTACTSCHSDQTGDGGFTLELVEATAHYDLLHKVGKPADCRVLMEAELKAGRLVVPFGAFSAMSHPGIYRTVTNPLMYNMGRQVNPDRARPPVLPMPYSDEGVDLFTKIRVLDDLQATLDVYAVNGLQGRGPGVQFTPSRSYTDNNSEPAVGGRATLGTGKWRLGGSVMAGELQDELADPMHYRLAGGDATARLFDDIVRLYFEYAIRDNESSFGDQQVSYGTVSEMEVLLCSQPNLNALVRYDTLKHRRSIGDLSIDRFTWGVSTTLLGGSLLIINHEHWNFSPDENDVDVIGFRWVATF